MLIYNKFAGAKMIKKYAGKDKSIKMNVLMNALLTMSSILFPLITFRYASRILLPVGIGKVFFAISLVSYFSMFAQLGIPTYGIRACVSERDDRNVLTKTAHESACGYPHVDLIEISTPGCGGSHWATFSL